MKKRVLFFSLLFIEQLCLMSAMDNEIKIAQALSEGDLITIEQLCKEEKIEFEKNFIVQIQYPNFVLKDTFTPLAFALRTNNLKLANLLCSYGAQPKEDHFAYIYCLGYYRFLPLFNRYFPSGFKDFDGNLLHLAVNMYKADSSHKLIAGIVSLYPEFLDEKYSFSQGSHSSYESAFFTPLEYAKSGWARYLESAQKVVEILENKELLEKTIKEVKTEFEHIDGAFRFQQIKKRVGLPAYLQGRKLGMSNSEIEQMQAFKKGHQVRITSGKEEE